MPVTYKVFPLGFTNQEKRITIGSVSSWGWPLDKALYIFLTHFILATVLKGTIYPYFTDKNTKALKKSKFAHSQFSKKGNKF